MPFREFFPFYATLELQHYFQGIHPKSTLHWPGIEPGPPAWQARILPLNHQCMCSVSSEVSFQVRRTQENCMAVCQKTHMQLSGFGQLTRPKRGWPPRRGIEPRSPAWQAGILTTILTRTDTQKFGHLFLCNFLYISSPTNGKTHDPLLATVAELRTKSV